MNNLLWEPRIVKKEPFFHKMVKNKFNYVVDTLKIIYNEFPSKYSLYLLVYIKHRNVRKETRLPFKEPRFKFVVKG